MPKAKLHDLIVLLPGITGSILRRDGRDVWAVSGQALWGALTSLGSNLEDLALPRHDPRKAAPDTPLTATRLINDCHGVFGLWRIDGYDAIVNALTAGFELWRGASESGEPQTNLILFPYDWRLSNRVSAQRLKTLVEQHLPAFRKATNNPGAKLILLAHSMGGLVSRYYLEVLEGWRDCRALVTFGTPYRGAVGAMGYLSNGYRKTVLGRSFLDLTDAMRTMPSVYELMPRYPALQKDGEWHRPAQAGKLPGIDEDYARAALEFHLQLDAAIDANRDNPDYMKEPYVIFPVIGASQPTANSASLQGGSLLVSDDKPAWLDDELTGGDGTVPRVSATPHDREKELREIFFAERHALLQRNDHVLFDLVERLKQMQAPRRIAAQGGVALLARSLGLAIDELYGPAEPVELSVQGEDLDAFGGPRAVIVGGPPDRLRREAALAKAGDRWAVNLGILPPGQYRISVATIKGGPGAPTGVHEVFEVAG